MLQPTTKSTAPKFEGSCDELKGHVFDTVGQIQSDSFVKTQEQLAIYVGSRSSSCGSMMAKAVETLKKPVIVTNPSPPTGCGTSAVDTAEKFLWEQEIKESIRDKKELENGVQQLHSLVIGQCSETMMARVDSHTDGKTVIAARDGIGLLKIIKAICFNFHDQKYIPQSIHEAKQRFYSIQQGQHDTVT